MGSSEAVVSEALIKSLSSSVASEAIPSVLDCILSCSTALDPRSLFDSLLLAFSNLLLLLLQAGDCLQSTTSISSFSTALCYLLSKSGTDHNALQAFIWEAYIPTMRIINVNHHQLLNLMAQQLCDVVVESNTWKVLDASLVPFCLRSIGISIGMRQNEESSVYQWSDIHKQSGFLDVPFANKQPISPLIDSLPLPVSCHILTSFLLTSLTSSQAQHNPPETMSLNGPSAHVFSRNLLWDISAMAIQMLSLTPDHRSCATHLLLPHVLRIFACQSSFQVSVQGKIHVLSRGCFFQTIWKRCQALFCHGTGERRDAYSILSLCLSILSPKEGREYMSICNGAGEFDIRTEQGFWDEINRGLVDKEAFVRKQSLNMLKMLLIVNDGKQSYAESSDNNNLHGKSSTSLGMTRRGQWAEKEAKSLGVGQVCELTDAQSDGQKKWSAFILLYEMLEEYGTHLVEAAWNHQISMLLNFPCPLRSSWDIKIGVNQSQMETLDGMFSWLAVLWERGLCHDNPQVRCLIMQSFLSIEWKDHKSCTELVPESFITGPFIQALNDTAHHREFGIQGVYSSNTIGHAANFLAQYCKHFKWRERVEFLFRLTSLVEQESFGRAGLMAFSGCIASAAYGVQWCEVCSCDLGQMESDVENIPHNSKADLLDTLRLVIESCKQHFNLNYRHQVCKYVLEAASSVICISGVPMETLVHFISTIPREFTDYGGSLRGSIQKWFSKCSQMLQSSDCSRTRKHALHCLCDFPKKFVGYHHSPDAVTYDDGDLEAWEVEAQRWARVFLLVTIHQEQLDIVFKFLQNCGTNINRQLHFLTSKFLIINLCLVQELHIMRLKAIGCVKLNCDMDNQGFGSDQLLTIDTSTIFEKFTFTFLMILEELVSFSKSACSTFWHSLVVTANLPSSVNGKLGGPSQRRLASCATTIVLEAILSMKTVASLSSWCTYFKSDGSVDFAFTFLWNFCQKVILCPKSNLDSETNAEISLAAYEALVPVLKAVASSLSSLLSNLIMASDKSFVPKVENQHWIDTLLLCFLQNVNELLGVGRLARSRRAVLMNWKWLGLSSLLSVFYWMTRDSAQFGTSIIFISTASLKTIYSDIVGSLENAGESSVLPMLQSVRLILELLALGRLDSTVLSPDGLTTEMIWDLVSSSWILHVNCKKRRVAHIAALLSSVLHCSVFCDATMHGTAENTGGPCKWFIEKIVEEGTKSPRTIRLAALHLTGLWLMYPRTIRYYIKELKLLSLYGSVAFDEDFEAELAESHDAKTEVSLLAKGLDVELTEAFMNTELYARVSVAVLFHELANVADKVGTTKESEDCHAARHAGKAFLLELLDSVLNDKDLSKELYKKYSGIHRRKVRAWQMLCVLSRFVDEDIVGQVTSSLHICLYRNNMPSVRQYLEIFAVEIYLKFPSLVKEQLTPIFRDYNMKPQALASYVFIAANIILHAPEESIRLRHLSDLLPPITPLLTSHHHSLRGFTQLLVYKVVSKMMSSSDSESVPLEKRCFEDLKCYLEKNSDCVRLRASMEGFIDTFDISKCATPAGIFIARDEGVDFECVPTSLMEQLNDFLNEVRDELRSTMAKDSVFIKNESFLTPLGKENPKDPLIISLDFQKKIILAKHEPLPLVQLEKEDELLNHFLQRRNADMERMKGNRQDIILVASLIDRIPNLAGLARTCEVFNASAIAVADASVVNDKQFQLISVTAEKWVPIIEVPVGSLKVYLKKKKGEGYSILGLEQTANSVRLDEYELPKKTVLVLGREKEGIPVDIIHMLDTCVEIPQLGVVRSLNVHVSGAIALWEYTRQHSKSNNKLSSLK